MEQEEEYTTISIKKNTWLRLNQRKAYPSQTFDVIINNSLDYEVANVYYPNDKGADQNEKTK